MMSSETVAEAAAVPAVGPTRAEHTGSKLGRAGRRREEGGGGGGGCGSRGSSSGSGGEGARPRGNQDEESRGGGGAPMEAPTAADDASTRGAPFYMVLLTKLRDDSVRSAEARSGEARRSPGPRCTDASAPKIAGPGGGPAPGESSHVSEAGLPRPEKRIGEGRDSGDGVQEQSPERGCESSSGSKKRPISTLGEGSNDDEGGEGVSGQDDGEAAVVSATTGNGDGRERGGKRRLVQQQQVQVQEEQAVFGADQVRGAESQRTRRDNISWGVENIGRKIISILRYLGRLEISFIVMQVLFNIRLSAPEFLGYFL